MRPRAAEPFVIRVVPAVVSSLRVVTGLQLLISFPANSYSIKHIYICINFYSYSRIGTNENNMKIRMWTVVLLTTIRKARNHCQEVDHCRDEDHCQYHFGIDHCQTGNAARIENTVRMEMSMQMIKTSGLP